VTFVTYLRRFAQGVTTLTAIEDDWEWKASTKVQARLALLERRMAWLERQLALRDSDGSGAGEPWPEALEAPGIVAEHPGERQIDRLERQTSVLYRQHVSLKDQGW